MERGDNRASSPSTSRCSRRTRSPRSARRRVHRAYASRRSTIWAPERIVRFLAAKRPAAKRPPGLRPAIVPKAHLRHDAEGPRRVARISPRAKRFYRGRRASIRVPRPARSEKVCAGHTSRRWTRWGRTLRCRSRRPAPHAPSGPCAPSTCRRRRRRRAAAAARAKREGQARSDSARPRIGGEAVLTSFATIAPIHNLDRFIPRVGGV